MKKGLKITLITLGSLLGLILLSVGIFLIVYKVKLDKTREENKLSKEEIRINELHQVIYEALPNEVTSNFLIKLTYEGYEDLTVSFTSSDENYLTKTGQVKRDLEDHMVTLTYEISDGTYQQTFEKNIKVLRKSGEELYYLIVDDLKKVITRTPENHFKLPTTLEKYPGLKITYNLEVINKRTNEVEESIQVKLIDDNYYLEFSESSLEEICFLEAMISIDGINQSQRFVILTKTTL